MGYSRQFALRGGLVSYNTDFADETRMAANWVGRILNGAMPADLPVRKSSKFELVINLKTAKALGVVGGEGPYRIRRHIFGIGRARVGALLFLRLRGSEGLIVDFGVGDVVCAGV